MSVRSTSVGRVFLAGLAALAIAGWMPLRAPARAAETASGSFSYVTLEATPLTIENPTPSQCYATDRQGGTRSVQNRTTAPAELFTDASCQEPLRQVAPREELHGIKSPVKSVRFSRSARTARGGFSYVTLEATPLTIDNPIPSECYSTDRKGGAASVQNRTTAQAELFSDARCQERLRQVAPGQEAHGIRPPVRSVRFSKPPRTVGGTFGYVTLEAAPLKIEHPTPSQCYPTDRQGGSRSATNRTTAQAALFSDAKCQDSLRQVAPGQQATGVDPPFKSVRFSE